MGILFWSLIFVVSLVVLIKSSDYFILSAEKIGLFFGLPTFIIGVIIVAMGTSLPELVSSIVAVSEGSSEIVVGNVLGSNVANIGLVIGIAALISKNFQVKYDIMKVDVPFMLGSAILLFFMLLDGEFSLPEAIICLVSLGIFVFYALRSKELETEEKPARPKFHIWLLLVATPFGIYFGAKYTIEAVISISEIAGIGSEIIALTAVALGTSLPEVFVSISAARKGKPEIAVGNIVGSNIFNSFAVMGIPRLVGKLIIPANILAFAAPVSVGITVFFLVIIMDKKLNPWIGGLLLIFYIFFVGRVVGFF
jgi:cation:H+ antiporter